MATPSQYVFDLKEAATALIKEQGIHEGVWVLGFEFTLGAGLFGTTPADMRPGAFAHIVKLQLTRHAEGGPEVPFAVDAAIVNPSRT
jgi:hypothetical protein